LGSIWAPFCLPKCLPFGTLLATKIDQKIHQKLNRSKSRPKIAPRAPKTLPRCPPDPPGEPQDLPRGLPDLSRMPPDALPDPLGQPKMLFRSIWPNNLFRKNRKSLNRRKHVEKEEVDNGHVRWSPASVLTKTESTFPTVGIRYNFLNNWLCPQLSENTAATY